ncbi:MAG: LysR family transcriptional regulator [Verrucomicrobiota bacterium]
MIMRQINLSPRVQIETFKLFCDLVETESFSEAAERNGITQSAVSQRMSALEKEFGAVLVERGKRSFGLTPEGRVFLEGSRAILETLEGTRMRLDELRNLVAGELRLTTVYSIGLHELSPHLKRFREEFPQVELEVSYRRATQIYSDVLEGRADMGFVAYPKERKGLVVESYWKDRLVLVCAPGHRFGKRKRLRLGDLAGEEFVSFEPDVPTRNALDAIFEAAGVEVAKVMEFDNVETVKRAVEIEGAASIIPLKAAAAEVEAGRLQAVPIEHGEMWRPLGIIRKRTKAVTPAMREFVEALKGFEEL